MIRCWCRLVSRLPDLGGPAQEADTLTGREADTQTGRVKLLGEDAAGLLGARDCLTAIHICL